MILFMPQTNRSTGAKVLEDTMEEEENSNTIIGLSSGAKTILF